MTTISWFWGKGILATLPRKETAISMIWSLIPLRWRALINLFYLDCNFWPETDLPMKLNPCNILWSVHWDMKIWWELWENLTWTTCSFVSSGTETNPTSNNSKLWTAQFAKKVQNILNSPAPNFITHRSIKWWSTSIIKKPPLWKIWGTKIKH